MRAHQAEKREAEGYRDDTVTLGRSRPLVAATVPHPVSERSTATTRENTTADVIAYWTARFEGGNVPPPSNGHGGFLTPPPGALTYKPSASLAALVRSDHPTCIHTGCTVPSVRCDLDHTVEFDKRSPLRGGWTVRANLAPLCRRHHNHKTDKLWRHSRLPDGTFHLTDPLGNHYFSVPNRRAA
ncbi:HNH endonuclease [Actinomycetes bacterium M1A6_2h]